MITNEQSRQWAKQIHENNWKAWTGFDDKQREAVKYLMREEGHSLHNAMTIVRHALYIF